MILQAFLIAIVSALLFMESRIGGQHMLDRPIVLAPIIGLIMGDLTKGLIIGGTLELVWMGLVGIGSTTPPDVIVGSALATAFAINSGADVEAALALAVPIALLAQLVQIGVNVTNTYFAHMADRGANNNDSKLIERSVWYGAFLYFITKFSLVFFGYILGAEAFVKIVEILPEVITRGIQVGTGFLPALGMAMLIDITIDKKFSPFLYLGFILVSFMSMNTMGVAAIGGLIAILYYKLSGNEKVKKEEVDF